MNNKDLLICIKRWHDCAPRRKADREAMTQLQSILAALELVTEKICDCDNYKWLIGELGREATFLYIHGLTIENRGSFKFCPYCGKQVIGEPTSAGGEDEKG